MDSPELDTARDHLLHSHALDWGGSSECCGRAIRTVMNAVLPPSNLPVTLVSVDDVAAVCQAVEGLTERAAGRASRIWQDAAGVRVWADRSQTTLYLAVIGTDGDQWSASGPRIALAPLWAAIHAARGVS